MLNPKRMCLRTPIAAAHENIFAFLLRVNEERCVNATLRVAGGWVRDTLLGLHSQDIDIAIESDESHHVSGERFAREVSAYQEEVGMASRTVSVIRVNPELSKHIETATVCVFDTPVEFCALRHDDYTVNTESRIPIVRPATPLEDSLRRDYTVNALFYNLHTREVEDYTTGLEDMERRVLRCPLDPRETFADDPLRLLRGVRFVGQLNSLSFALDESIYGCVDAEILAKLKTKVSRERIGKEFAKMFSGGASEVCVDLLMRLGIMQSVLLAEIYIKTGKKQKPSAEAARIEYLCDGAGAQTALESIAQLNRALAPLLSRTGSPLCMPSPEDHMTGMLFCVLLPFYRGVSRDLLADRLYAVCVNGLKLPLATYHTLRRMMDCYNALLRHRIDLRACATHWTDEAKLALFDGLCELSDKVVMPVVLRLILAAYLQLEHNSDINGVGEGVWATLEREPGLIDAATRALPLRGNEIAKLAQLDAKQIGPALLALRRHTLLNPHVSADEMIAWLRTVRGEL